ncbi:MAG: DUF1592 domain-containing protein [Planctomycetales bacterium]|nr:DUF1592 domain-containing protein [Planctomycetales bacterium]
MLSAAALLALLLAPTVVAKEKLNLEQQEKEYLATAFPLVRQYCLDCHSTDAREGELDLERFSSFDQVRRDSQAWQKIASMLSNGEMPPADSPQLEPREKQLLQDWVQKFLDAEARANAGDPGPVVLRRLNNAEYTYTIRDLTGVQLSPTHEFPADGAAGEGFTNTGNALAMSPALVAKYLEAAKGIADHMVLLPEGFRFSPHKTRRDWTNEILASIQSIYFRYTGDPADASVLNRWDVSDPTTLTNADGRVDLEAYFRVLIQHRDHLANNRSQVEELARNEGLSATYLLRLAEMLTSKEPSALLDRVRLQWQLAEPNEAREVAQEIRTWQDQLWRFNPVGQFGQVKGWQVPATPMSSVESLRVALELSADVDEIKLYLTAGSAGDGNRSDRVVWKRPRIERPGSPPLMLRDLRAVSFTIPRKRDEFLASIAEYLAAARELQTTETSQDVALVAAARRLDPLVLESWLKYLGIAYSGNTTIKEYLDSPITGLAGYDFVKGWGVAGQAALSLVSNASDETVKIPGSLKPHKIAVHPRPERWVAVAWQSPIEGRVRLEPAVIDAHSQCGNGVSWALELRRGGHRRVLSTGNVDLGGTASIEPIEGLPIRQGELVSLIISSRDNDHSCDLTEVELDIVELDGERRSWSLSGDCADSIEAGNPHADQHGNAAVWHFYTGMDRSADKTTIISPNSLLAQWLATTDPTAAERLAADIETLFRSPLPDNDVGADAEVYRQLSALDGPLFSLIDPAALADTISVEQLADVGTGLDPRQFANHSDDTTRRAVDLLVDAPSILEIKIPRHLAANGVFVVDGSLASDTDGDASAQLLASTQPPSDADVLLAGKPVVTHPGSEAEQRFRQSFDQFRALFPAAMCYSRIVPVDAGVTLVLFYREDDQFSHLLLDEEERALLDKLWDELHFVSQDALSLVTGFEQLLEFASQDDDPNKYRPMGEAINAAANAFRARLVETEPRQLDALVDFAARAYRRPLEPSEDQGIRQFYELLRAEDIPHDEAMRLTLVRVLTGPAFLYRIEHPPGGADRGLVTDWELASRLSYFLWSSAPDDQLRATAAAGRLQQPDALVSELERMTQDRRIRQLAIEFACQWLHIRDFAERKEKSERHFPTFANLQGDMAEEPIQFFADMFQNDGSVLGIIGADHAFLNESLAGHYGIPGVEGAVWRRVENLRDHSRGGILAQAAFLASQSGASRTSPILRGNWISETLLGERLPRPPKDVPVLPETVPADLTERQLIEQHTTNPSCAKCHARIDPYGFALEEFDAIGKYRQQDNSGHAIDTHSTLLDGTEVVGLEGLRTYLLTTRRDAFVRQFCRKLLGYSLGRAVQLSDEPLLDDMMHNLAANQYRVSRALKTIVLSDQFRMIRGRDYQGSLPAIAAAQ